MQGFADDDLLELDVTFARFAVPRLRRFKQMCGPQTIPPGDSFLSWMKKLDEMILGFEEMQRSLPDPLVYRPALKLFAKHLEDLYLP